MKILFLGVDGVLNSNETKELIPDTNFTGIDNKYVKRLKKIVDATDAQIVLCSTWRLEKSHGWDHDLTGSRKYLQKKLDKCGLRYVSQTPDLSKNGIMRGHEIQKWLDNNNDITIDSWIVLDDECFSDYEECKIMEHLIRTVQKDTFGKYINGLSEENVEEAIKLLNGGN